MPETAREVFMEMRERIDHVLLTDWHQRIVTLTAAYDAAFANVNDLLQQAKAAVIARQQRENALMITTLSILTGGAASVLGEELVKAMPAVEKTVFSQQGGLLRVMKVAEEDRFLYKFFKETTKDLVKKGVEKADDLALDEFKGEPPESGFQPVGMRVAEYTDALTQGIDARAQFLWNFADFLYQTADTWTPDLADIFRQGLYRNEFFQRKHLAPRKKLEENAELALWAAWALPRDEDYWNVQLAMVPYGRSESFDWAPVRSRLIELGVPEDAITAGVKWNPRAPKGLDVIGLKKWAKSGDFVHTLFDGIPGAGGAVSHWAQTKMMQATYLAAALPAGAKTAA